MCGGDPLLYLGEQLCGRKEPKDFVGKRETLLELKTGLKVASNKMKGNKNDDDQ